MIEKMTFLSITGPKPDFDRVVETYLSKYEMHLENAMTEMKNAQGIAPFLEENPYKEELQQIRSVCKEYAEMLPQASQKAEGDMPLERAVEVVHDLTETLTGSMEQKKTLKDEIALLEESYRKIVPFIGLNYDIRKILHFDHIKYSFGRMPVEYYQKLQEYVYDSMDALISECTRDGDFVYLVYFVPQRDEDKVDAVFASMYFEKIFIPDDYTGSPEEQINQLHEKIKDHQEKVFRIDVQIAEYLQNHGAEILEASARLERQAVNFDVRKYAACTKHDYHTFYIICGWMGEKDAKRFRKEIEEDEKVFCFAEKDVSKLLNGPPTKLRHPAILKPFEMFLEMYGLPSYNEIDPTPLLALTYMVFFGFMFGDLGQGAVLCIGGALLYRLKGMRLAGIISCCGVFSMIFGLLFGSVFGFEDVIEPLWLHPQTAMTNLPFFGSLNTVFVVAVAIGMGIILLCMVLNIINGLRQHNAEKAVLDTNGIVGLIFYGSIVLCVVLYMTGHALPAAVVLLVMFGIPLLLLFLKEPIMNKVQKKAELIEGGAGMFITQGFFEMFEMLLSYFSNTLSFVRIGAFAVSHAAMMGVVMMLAGAESGGSISWPVVILGNLFICGLEGLIVGIQVLRLEYYELFSRFYTGGGRAFRPYGKEEKAA